MLRAFGGFAPPRTYQGLCRWTPLENFRPPDLLCHPTSKATGASSVPSAAAELRVHVTHWVNKPLLSITQASRLARHYRSCRWLWRRAKASRPSPTTSSTSTWLLDLQPGLCADAPAVDDLPVVGYGGVLPQTRQPTPRDPSRPTVCRRVQSWRSTKLLSTVSSRAHVNIDYNFHSPVVTPIHSSPSCHSDHARLLTTRPDPTRTHILLFCDVFRLHCLLFTSW